LLLSAIAGPDERCPISITEPASRFAQKLDRNFKGVRIAWFKDTDRFQVTADALVSEGASIEMIMAALVTVGIKAGHSSRRPEAILDAAERAFANAAYDAFERAKDDRATKRRKRLGLPEP